ncbi:MAG: hypothetical protein CO032_05500 [Nitrosopumilales archaeon CG_4_9_14_0_2_um_filter_34_16]|nr:MAG: hypothetical protein CO032_05500 [Nitrosopumilales archaeon CG_4_9_14_0_2_um_filter_34_16]
MTIEFLPIVEAGFNAILEYLASHTIFCLVPAFFIAGAMSTLIPKDKLLKYLGKDSPKYKAYPLAVVAGLLLAACSCTVIPLFAGIRKSGAGLGPAMVFLYTAPATNIVAVLYTGSLIGWDIAFSRIGFSISFAILIGLTISRMFPDKPDYTNTGFGQTVEQSSVKRLIFLFAALIAILFVGTRVETEWIRHIIEIILVGIIALIMWKMFTKSEFMDWMKETLGFVKTIGPLLIAGVFFSGILIYLLPQNIISDYVGDNSLFALIMPVAFGAFAYFPTLVEVPMANAFLQLGMAKGPLLAYLLADPVISLPSILAVRKYIGSKRIAVYVGMIVVLSILGGFIYGSLNG